MFLALDLYFLFFVGGVSGVLEVPGRGDSGIVVWAIGGVLWSGLGTIEGIGVPCGRVWVVCLCSNCAVRGIRSIEGRCIGTEAVAMGSIVLVV